MRTVASFPEAGIDAVDYLAQSEQALDDRARGAHAFARSGGNFSGQAFERNGVKLLEREALAVELHRTHGHHIRRGIPQTPASSSAGRPAYGKKQRRKAHE